jgi:tau tubulin kinase
MGKGKYKNGVYMVDFGLAKLHLNKGGYPFPQRQNADFRGTITYASLNAHNKIVILSNLYNDYLLQDLSRRDDLWSFYFVILDFLNEQLPWRNCKDNKVVGVIFLN